MPFANIADKRAYQREYNRRWQKANPDKLREYQRRYKAHAEKRRHPGLPKPTRPYQTTCECCGEAETAKDRTGGIRRLVLDHCHETGVFRGWLCHRCNAGIGMLGDTMDKVQRAVSYLAKVRVK